MPIPALYRQLDTRDQVLRRYLSIYADQLNIIKSFSEAFPTIFDVDQCDVKFLPYLAQFLSVITYAGMDINQVRKFIKNAVFSYGSKGTVLGLQIAVTTITGWPCVIVEKGSHVALTNDLAYITVSPTFLALEAMIGYNAAIASIAALYDGVDPNPWLKLVIYALTNNDPLTVSKTALLNAILADEVPVGVSWSWVYILGTCEAPIASPSGGVYGVTQTVTLSSVTPSTQIYYTLDGTTPTRASTHYTGPVTVSVPNTLKSVTVSATLADSPIDVETYT